MFYAEYDNSYSETEISKDTVCSFTISPLQLYKDYRILITLRNGDIVKELFTTIQPMKTRRLEPLLGIGETIQQTRRMSDAYSSIYKRDTLEHENDVKHIEFTASDYGTLNVYLYDIAEGNDYDLRLFSADMSTILRTSAVVGNCSELITMPVQKNVSYIIEISCKQNTSDDKTFNVSATFHPFEQFQVSREAVTFSRPIGTNCPISAYVNTDTVAGLDRCYDYFGKVEPLDRTKPADDPWNWPDYRAYDQHKGTDYAGYSAVYSSATGEVAFAGWHDNENGNVVIIEHDDGYETWYCHLSSIAVSQGQIGAVSYIGHSGDTGLADADCLHFVIYSGTRYVCPFVNSLLSHW